MIMLKWFAAAVLLTFSTAALAAPPARVATGMLSGKDEGKASAYLGIPYAAPASGANRWRAPKPPLPWNGVRDAAKFGDSCMQSQAFQAPGQNGPGGGPGAAGPGAAGPGAAGPGAASPGGPPLTLLDTARPGFSEDCLFVNVWTPAAKAGKLPVVVFFHGGGWSGGSGAGAPYGGANLAGAHGVVMVTVNFRLGLFGFMASPWLMEEAGDAGNYGLMDQVAALQWVKRNIAAFGGDPNRVTIAGQSSGSAAVRAMASIPAANGLFQRAIAESTPFRGAGPMPLAEALQRGEALAKLAGASSLAQLRAMPAATLQKLVSPGLPRDAPLGFMPVIGTRFWPDGAGERTNVTIIAGSNTHESGREWDLTEPAALDAMIAARFNTFAPRFASLYAPSLYGSSVNAAARAIIADGPATELVLRQQTRSRDAAPIYQYLWTHARPGDAGATHGSELAYVYDNLGAQPRNYTDKDAAIAKTMTAYWVNFIKTGDPNGPGLPKWPQARSGLTMELGTDFAPRQALSPEKLAAYRDFSAAGGEYGLP
jgi:para-nitrobenzyl esterase